MENKQEFQHALINQVVYREGIRNRGLFNQVEIEYLIREI